MRRAARVAPFHVRGSCDCAVCSEREQLHDVAAWHPEASARVIALSLLGAMEAVHNGRVGSIELMQLFD